MAKRRKKHKGPTPSRARQDAQRAAHEAHGWDDVQLTEAILQTAKLGNPFMTMDAIDSYLKGAARG